MGNRGMDSEKSGEYKRKFRLDTMRLPAIKKSEQVSTTKREITLEKMVIFFGYN